MDRVVAVLCKWSKQNPKGRNYGWNSLSWARLPMLMPRFFQTGAGLCLFARQ
jgi:hypothetical protein